MSNSPIPPTPKHVLTSLLTSLNSITPPVPPTTHDQSHPSPLASFPNTSQSQSQTKSILLTLHFLFPHELLPALDLIDHRLITHLSTPLSPDQLSPNPQLEIYYVQSASSLDSNTNTNASARKGRFRNALRPAQGRGQFYEVRLDSWNCSCPAFAFSALKLMMRETGLNPNLNLNLDSNRSQDGRRDGQSTDRMEWAMGGVATKEDAVMPVCKHILAVALGRAAPGLFGSGVVEREVSPDEIAGWAAGWGEH